MRLGWVGDATLPWTNRNMIRHNLDNIGIGVLSGRCDQNQGYVLTKLSLVFVVVSITCHRDQYL